jgi:exodeoxyribonuclease VII large subunit
MGAELRLLERHRSELRGLVRVLPAGEDVVAIPRQKLDRAAERLREKLEGNLREAHLRLNRAAGLLARHSPQAEFARISERYAGLNGRLMRLRPALTAQASQRLESASQRLVAARRAQLSLHVQTVQARRERLGLIHGRLHHAFRSITQRRQERVTSLTQLFESLSYKAVLSRGYAIVRNAQNEPVRLGAQLNRGDLVSVQFADKAVQATVGEGAAPDAARPRKAPPKADQGSLF